jgi:hypothetical protein
MLSPEDFKMRINIVIDTGFIDVLTAANVQELDYISVNNTFVLFCSNSMHL